MKIVSTVHDLLTHRAIAKSCSSLGRCATISIPRPRSRSRSLAPPLAWATCLINLPRPYRSLASAFDSGPCKNIPCLPHHQSPVQHQPFCSILPREGLTQGRYHRWWQVALCTCRALNSIKVILKDVLRVEYHIPICKLTNFNNL